MKPPVSVILVRENAEQLTGGGCCGALDDDDPTVRGRGLFRHVRRQQEELGLLHRTIRKFYPAEDGGQRVAVVTVDPRNQLYLTFKLIADVLRYRPGVSAGVRTALQMFSLPAVILNGRVVSRRDRPLDPDTLCHMIGETLGDRS